VLLGLLDVCCFNSGTASVVPREDVWAPMSVPFPVLLWYIFIVDKANDSLVEQSMDWLLRTSLLLDICDIQRPRSKGMLQ
jgi:hypothetical protein